MLFLELFVLLVAMEGIFFPVEVCELLEIKLGCEQLLQFEIV